MTRPLAALLLVLGLAGCGGQRAHGTASLWVTRDRGARVLLVRTVPAGLTAMQALSREAKVETRYGGRFVQAISGIEGDASKRRDWFYFVNGIESDVGAADYRLHDGDVEWWDFRSWKRSMQQPVVVGAFPEPFVHGFGGQTRPAVVVGSGPVARKLARLVHGRVAASAPPDANVLEIRGVSGFTGTNDGRVRFVIGSRDAARLAADPSLARYRYEGLR